MNQLWAINLAVGVWHWFMAAAGSLGSASDLTAGLIAISGTILIAAGSIQHSTERAAQAEGRSAA